jgi:hypothetical protein
LVSVIVDNIAAGVPREEILRNYAALRDPDIDAAWRSVPFAFLIRMFPYGNIFRRNVTTSAKTVMATAKEKGPFDQELSARQFKVRTSVK